MKLNNSIVIKAKAERIWNVITQNNYVKQYMFNCEIESDWREGSNLIYHLQHEGKRIDAVLGVIKKIDPPYLLHHSLFPAGASYPNIPENHIYAIYKITENEDNSLLEVEQGGYETVAEGDKRFADSQGGWEMILPTIKKLAEAE